MKHAFRLLTSMTCAVALAACGGGDGGGGPADGGSPDGGDPGCGQGTGSGPYFPADGGVCENLSSYNLISLDDQGNVVPTDGVLPYDLNTPLFSDYAKKTRTLWVPGGESAPYSEDGFFDLPVGTMITKTFAFPADWREPDQNVDAIETRVLIHLDSGWEARPYVWNDDHTEAVYTPIGGAFPVSWIDPTGAERSTTYLVPNKNQCIECHGSTNPTTGRKDTGLIGPKAKHINKDFDYGEFIPGDMPENELRRWADAGFLSGVPADPTTAPAVEPFGLYGQPSMDGATLDAQARGYLDANCSHCHNSQGAAEGSGLMLSVEEADPLAWGVCQQLQRGIGGMVTYDVVPGSPDMSAIYVRMGSNDPAVAMPRIGRSVVHEEGLELIRQWILWLGTPEGIAAYGLDDPQFTCF